MLTPLVLLPGLLCDAALWHAQMNDLADIAAMTVPDLTQDDSIEAMAARVLAGAPARFALCALSMGGYVAFEIMRRAPERVTRLALLDTSAAADTPSRAAERRAAMQSLEHGRFIGMTTRLLPQLVHASKVAGPEGEEVMAMARRVGGAAFLRQQAAILGRPDSVPDLSRIAVPTLVAVGDSDVLTPLVEARTIAEGVSGATLHTFSSCGHLPSLEKPQETSDVLRRWLEFA